MKHNGNIVPRSNTDCLTNIQLSSKEYTKKYPLCTIMFNFHGQWKKMDKSYTLLSFNVSQRVFFRSSSGAYIYVVFCIFV